MEEARLDAEGAATANEIRRIDRELDRIEAKVREYVALGLRGGGMNQAQRAIDDEERDGLLERRSVLALRLRRLVAGPSDSSGERRPRG